MKPSETRRGFLGAVGVGSTLALAGCLGSGSSGDGGDGDEDGPDALGGSEADPAIEFSDGRALSSELPIELYDVETDELTGQVDWHEDEGLTHWHHMPLEVPVGETKTYRMEIEYTTREPIPIGEDEIAQTNWQLVEPSPGEGFVDIETDGDRLHLTGNENGEAGIYFEFVYDGETEFETPEGEIVVGDGAAEDHDHEE